MVEQRFADHAPRVIFMASPGRRQAWERAMDDRMIDTPDGPMSWGEWKKKNPVQIPSRRTKGKDLPNKVKRSTDG